ncbi:MAG: hypothetical protein AB1420_16100 [Bacillota bacterium]
MIPTNTVVAVRCPECGSVEYISVSLFSFSHANQVSFNCSCGSNLLKISAKLRRSFWLQYYCAMCEGRHLLSIARRQMWFAKEAIELVCDDTGIEVGYVGPKEKVKERVNNQDQSLAGMADQLGFTEYFINSAVMYDVLDHVYNLAEKGKIYCSCGNSNVEVEIFAEHIELSCNVCKARGKIMAETEENLQAVKCMWELKLTRKGFRSNKQEDFNKHNADI